MAFTHKTSTESLEKGRGVASKPNTGLPQELGECFTVEHALWPPKVTMFDNGIVRVGLDLEKAMDEP